MPPRRGFTRRRFIAGSSAAAAAAAIRFRFKAQRAGLMLEAEAHDVPASTALTWAFGGVSGRKGARNGDIGCEVEPVSRFFQVRPEECAGNRYTLEMAPVPSSLLESPTCDLQLTFPAGSHLSVADAGTWAAPLVAADPAQGQSARLPVYGAGARQLPHDLRARCSPAGGPARFRRPHRHHRARPHRRPLRPPVGPRPRHAHHSSRIPSGMEPGFAQTCGPGFHLAPRRSGGHLRDLEPPAQVRSIGPRPAGPLHPPAEGVQRLCIVRSGRRGSAGSRRHAACRPVVEGRRRVEWRRARGASHPSNLLGRADARAASGCSARPD